MISVRLARPDDLDAIIGFITALADYERLADRVRLDPVVLRGHLFGDRPMAEVLIAERGGEGSPGPAGSAVGFALFFHSFSTFEGRPGLYLEDLFVSPSARGAGAGVALLAALAQIAVARGCARLEWSVLDWNEPAIGFYRSLGAVAMDEWTVNRVDGDALAALAARALPAAPAGA